MTRLTPTRSWQWKMLVQLLSMWCFSGTFCHWWRTLHGKMSLSTRPLLLLGKILRRGACQWPMVHALGINHFFQTPTCTYSYLQSYRPFFDILCDVLCAWRVQKMSAPKWWSTCRWHHCCTIPAPKRMMWGWHLPESFLCGCRRFWAWIPRTYHKPFPNDWMILLSLQRF